MTIKIEMFLLSACYVYFIPFCCVWYRLNPGVQAAVSYYLSILMFHAEAIVYILRESFESLKEARLYFSNYIYIIHKDF